MKTGNLEKRWRQYIGNDDNTEKKKSEDCYKILREDRIQNV